MIEYLIESTLCFAILFLVFEFFFKNTTNYSLNRFILLFSLLFSFLVPLVSISTDSLPVQSYGTGTPVFQILPISNYLPTTDGLINPSNENGYLDIFPIVTFIYAVVAIVFLLRFVLHLRTLLLKWRTAEKVNHKGHPLSLITEDIPPFTFFQTIFVNKTEYENDKLEKELLIHEIAHKYQWHSIDIVLIELLQIVFWFNPFVYLFKRRVKVNHEYLSDDFVLRCGANSKDYANQLLNYSFPHKIAGFASAFNNHSTIKNRLIMLSKFQEKQPRSYRLLLLIPVLTLLFISTAFDETSLLPSNPLAQTQHDELLENPGVIYGNNLIWSSEDGKVYIRGEKVRIQHGDNNFNLRGRASYLGEVHYFIFNGKEAPKDQAINIAGMKCTVLKLSPDDGVLKYGPKAKKGAVEITTTIQ